MTDKDPIIKFLDKEELKAAAPESFSYIGWEGNGYFAFYLFAENYHIAAQTIYDKMVGSGRNNAILDGLIYPLIFAHRHFCELMLKGLYFEFSNETEENLKKFLNRCGHDLMRSWAEVKPLISRGKKHVGSKVNIGAIEHYLSELNQFDPDSMAMRYPVTKNLEKMREKWQHLDFHNFHDRMEELYNALNQIKYDISNQVKINHTDQEMADFMQILEQYKPKFMELLSILEPMDQEEEDEGKLKIKSLFSESDEGTLFTPPVRPDLDLIFSNGDDFLMLVETLYYCGRHIQEHLVTLSQKPEEAKQELICVCIDQMHYDNFEFGKTPEESNINIDSKSPSAILQHISTSLNLLGLLP